MSAGGHSRVLEPIKRAALAAIIPIAGSTKAVRTTRPVVAVTFDDGPDPETTPQILDVLGAAGSTATFFMLVERAEAHPALVERIVSEGHEVGLHGIDHARLTTLPNREVWHRMRTGRDRLARVAGVPIRHFRPPHGAQSPSTLAAARAARLRSIMWSADGGDWMDTTIDAVVARVAENARPGGVIVLHDTLFVTPADEAPPVYDRAKMTAAVLDHLHRRGTASITVSELLAEGAPVRSVWFRR